MPPTRIYKWRCVCGAINEPTQLVCIDCRHQRWGKLGFSPEEARGILENILPSYIQDKKSVTVIDAGF